MAARMAEETNWLSLSLRDCSDSRSLVGSVTSTLYSGPAVTSMPPPAASVEEPQVALASLCSSV
eukprot:5482779-Amphidinium_carterae.1